LTDAPAERTGQNRFSVGEVMVMELFVPPLEVEFAVVKSELPLQRACGCPQQSAVDISRRRP
jgi:hypothetical protein